MCHHLFSCMYSSLCGLYSLHGLIGFLSTSAFLLEQSASRHHHRPAPVINMDAQWQQYYWNHYLLQQQQQHQLTSGTDAPQYTPTATYGPMSHSIRTHQQHQSHPYTPPPPTGTSPSFPPPPPPPLPTASPTTPTHTSFKHSPSHSAPPAPPATVPFPTRTTQESWHSTDSCWDSNALHGHQLQRNGPDASGLPACQLLRSSPGSSHITERLTIQPGLSVMASFAASSQPEAWPTPFSLHTSYRRFAISAWTWTLSQRPCTQKPAPPSPIKQHKPELSTLHLSHS